MRSSPLVLLCLLAPAMPAHGCTTNKRAHPQDELLLGAYTAPREALERAIIPRFRDTWWRETGRELMVRASYLGSGAQARAVTDGFPADVVMLALEPDVDKIVKRGLIAPDWRERTGNRGIVARTLVVIAVRKGNPKRIADFADLARPGLEVLTPNPRTSGGAMWNLLAMYGSAPAGEAGALLRAVSRNVVVMDKGARESLVNFERGIGDAAITYEQEVHVALMGGRRYDYVVPPVTMAIEIPAAVVDQNVDARGTRAVAERFVAFLRSEEAQFLIRDFGFRPAEGDLHVPDPRFQPPQRVLYINDMGGWTEAVPRFFGPKGIITRLLEEGHASR
ncbi:MAG: sulfate ABC transporter substrate-binding protein [Deltaproteobacteria bacterium]|nr:sulfate ABC transporter substrate-binding protein [Deltaproteobacteria bacterium]